MVTIQSDGKQHLAAILDDQRGRHVLRLYLQNPPRHVLDYYASLGIFWHTPSHDAIRKVGRLMEHVRR